MEQTKQTKDKISSKEKQEQDKTKTENQKIMERLEYFNKLDEKEKKWEK